jgi:hypothetical protein
MKRFCKVALTMAVFVLGSTLPVMSQIDNGLDFTTSFPFFAGNAKMPAGSYKVTQTDIDASELLIQSTDGKYSAFVEFIATRSPQPHTQSDVTFQKYGSVEYLDRIWVEGQRYGMKLDPTKAEKKAAANAAPVEHSIVGKKH